MVSVTQGAKEELKRILISTGAGLDEGLRLLPRPDGTFVLAQDSELAGDEVVKYKGFKVLLVGIEHFNILKGLTVDCRDTEDGGPRLFVRVG